VPGGSQFAFGNGTSPQGGFSNVQNEQMMAMLRQLLQQTHGDNIAAAVKKEQAEDDVRDEDGAADEKGAGRTRADKTQERTAAAERRSSFGSDSSCSSSSSSSSDDNDSDFPNPWARFRHSMREPFAEFLGTMLLILFGTGVSLQVFLSSDPNVVSSQRGQYLSISFGWGIGVAMGVWVAGGISGGHINPGTRRNKGSMNVHTPLTTCMYSRHILFSHLQRVPMEESTRLCARSDLGQHDCGWHQLWSL
jgi:hypothetical protein